MSKEIVLEVRDDISEKILFSHGFLVLVIIVIADNKPMELCYRCYYIIFFIIYFLMPIILKYIGI